MTCVLPAILARDEADFRARVQHPALRSAAAEWHVDVLDGSMFHATCWADPAVVGTWSDLPQIELHVMSHNPLPHIEAWHAHVPTLQRAIIHAEIARPHGAILERIHQLHLDAGLAVNPETSLEHLSHILHLLDVLQIMGIQPGASGRPFAGDGVLAKIRRAKKLFPQLAVSVDGGVSLQNAPTLLAAGAERLVTSSALWRNANPLEVFQAFSLL